MAARNNSGRQDGPHREDCQHVAERRPLGLGRALVERGGMALKREGDRNQRPGGAYGKAEEQRAGEDKNCGSHRRVVASAAAHWRVSSLGMSARSYVGTISYAAEFLSWHVSRAQAVALKKGSWAELAKLFAPS